MHKYTYFVRKNTNKYTIMQEKMYIFAENMEFLCKKRFFQD
nr:MAG TPA: hypothetical protein [Caudoviricetes sp.]